MQKALLEYIDTAKNDAVYLSNVVTTCIFQPPGNFENFEIHLYFVCQPASLPACHKPRCARCGAPEISHNNGNCGGFNEVLFQR